MNESAFPKASEGQVDPMRGLARTLLTLWTLAAALAFGLALHRIATVPGLTPWREATLAEIATTTDRMMALQATPDTISGLIGARLGQDPRNWLALDALRQVAADRGLPLPADLTQEFDRLRAEDSGLLAQTGACLACMWDAASCSLTQVLLCQAPVNLTPVGDVFGLARGLKDYLLDNPVDGFDLALSVVGLGATVATLPSGGSAEVVKVGAGLLKTAARMGRISPPLRAMFETALRDGILWERVAGTDWLLQPGLLVRSDAFLPATRTVAALDELYQATDLTTVLHVLPMVDRAEDAAGLARAAKATGQGFLGKAEVLGKSRLLRAGLRATRAAQGLLAGFLALAAGLAGLAGSLVDGILRNLLRRSASAGRLRHG